METKKEGKKEKGNEKWQKRKNNRKGEDIISFESRYPRLSSGRYLIRSVTLHTTGRCTCKILLWRYSYSTRTWVVQRERERKKRIKEVEGKYVKEGMKDIKKERKYVKKIHKR